MIRREPRLPDVRYLAFPFRIGAQGGAQAGRLEHIRQQIEQLLFTTPGERPFRPEFGLGARALVFEPNSSALWAVAKKRLEAGLGEALVGEVDPQTLEVEIFAAEEAPEQLIVRIAYTLAAIQRREEHRLLL